MSGTPYAETVAYLFGLQRHGIKLGLEPMRRLMLALGSPHERLPVLHIGGTNGKGSTAAMAASMLRAAGYRVGLYTSPHLIDFRERIQVDGQPIEETVLAELTARLRSVCPSDLPATFFEFTTALALDYFAQAGVEVAVLEVGMGGRFDATNVVTPLASCITTVALDHEQYLGHDAAAIAFEKAGIVKASVPLVIGRMPAAARTVVLEVARAKGASVGELGKHFSVDGGNLEACTYRRDGRSIWGIDCPLRGRHQLDNLACAIALVEAVAPKGIVVDEAAVRRGLAMVQWPGRLEVVSERPQLVLDGAHNPAAAMVVAEYLHAFRGRRPSAKIWLVLGMMQDKDHHGFIRIVAPFVDEAVVVVPQLARAASGEHLKAAFPSTDLPIRIIPAVGDALRHVHTAAAGEDLICVTGSLMLIGEARAYLQGVCISPLRG